MKTRLFAAAVSVAWSLALCAEPAPLEVHEWGTFTIVSGSDGLPLRWYQPEKALAELPPFVQHEISIAGKTGAGTLSLGSSPFLAASPTGFMARMETPVIYFYPEHPMSVSVSAQFFYGRLTEWFPATVSGFAGTGGAATWQGDLVAPDDPTAAAQIPAATSPKGEHYAHAREVPGAWYFHGANKGFPASSSWEKFIFYRGAGDAVPPVSAVALEDQTVKLSRFDTGPLVKAFALRVEGNEACWNRMQDLPGVSGSRDGKLRECRVSLKGPLRPVQQVDEELGSAMESELSGAGLGLSEDEARAMVATWRDAWFRENGTRIFVLLPRPWVDQVLPLTIKPQPQKLTRVFVGRFELFTPERENALLTLLGQPGNEGADAVARFKEMRLGRFTSAAVQRVKNLMNLQADLRWGELERASELQPATVAR